MPRIDWCNKEQVIAYAKSMGKGQTVIKHDNRNNYNITHTSRKDRWDILGVTVVLHT